MDDLITVHDVGYDGHDTDLASTIRDALLAERGWGRGGGMRNSHRIDDANDDDDDDEKLATTSTIDFLFIDHDKDAYLSDLIKLESRGMIRVGTRVVADNVIFANIDDYLSYVRNKMDMGIVMTRTIPCHVEYYGGEDDDASSSDDSRKYQDGMGECFNGKKGLIDVCHFMYYYYNSLLWASNPLILFFAGMNRNY
jgi:hypothetical protein